MKRSVAFAFMVVVLLVLAVWAIGKYVQPILPSDFNNELVLIFAALLAVLAVLAQFKDVIELFSRFSKDGDRVPKKKVESINLGNRLFSRQANISVNIKVLDLKGQVVDEFIATIPTNISANELLERVRKKRRGRIPEVDYDAAFVPQDNDTFTSMKITDGTILIFQPRLSK